MLQDFKFHCDQLHCNTIPMSYNDVCDKPKSLTGRFVQIKSSLTT